MKGTTSKDFNNRSLTISDDDVAEFRSIYKKRFGKLLNEEKARKKLALVVRQLEMIYQPITSDDLADLEGKTI